MSGDIAGKVFKNVSGNSLQITDVGQFEIRPDHMVSTGDYPVLERSTQFRRFVALSYLLEDPSMGGMISSGRAVQTQALPQAISDDDLDILAEKLAQRMRGSAVPPQVAPGLPPTMGPPTPVRPPVDRGEADRAAIINYVIQASLPTVEQFGDIEEIHGEEIPDVEEMVQRIQNMGGPPPDAKKP